MKEKSVPESVERVREQFEEWRGRRKSRERIPEELWKAAAKVARRHGVNAVSRVLHVEHAKLRQRVEGTEVSGEVATRGFIEVDMAPESGAGCLVELEKSNGTRMRICVGDGSAVDWTRMKEAFLGA